MSKYSSLGKPLAGIAVISPMIANSLTESVGSLISNGSLVFSNINITGGQIDGVILGGSNPGPSTVTSLTSGSPGIGYLSCFYGNTIGDSACWLPSQGQWNIAGDLLVRDISDLGHLRVSVNTISSSNTNGNINLSPNGSGIINISSGLSLSTVAGNINLQTNAGSLVATAKNVSLSSQKNTNFTTGNGSIALTTGQNILNSAVTLISTGLSSVTVTTSSAHGLVPGDTINLSGVNTTPNTNGVYIVTSVPTVNSFVIPVSVPITSIGTTGNVRLTNNIYLTATDSIYIPANVPIKFGGSSSVVSDGTTTTLTSGNVVINGTLTVTGASSVTHSSLVTVDDPVFNVGGTGVYTVADAMDRGVSFHYYNNGDKIGYFGRNTSSGCFTYIPDATENGNVYTGASGCASFGALSVTSINTNSGTVSSIGNLNTCNISCTGTLSITSTLGTTITSPSTTITGTLNVCAINCSGALSITSGSTVVTSANTTITGNASIAGTLSVCNISCSGTLGITSGSTVVTSANTTITGNASIAGTLNVCNISCSGTLGITSTSTVVTSANTSITGNVSIAGTSTMNNVVITGTVTGITLNEVTSKEHLSITGGATVSPTFDINITFINVTSSGISSGILSAPGIDGFEKKIICSGLALNSSYELYCPTGTLLDPDTGTTIAKYIQFEVPGQSVYMVWDNVMNCYMIISASVCCHS